MEDSFLKQEPLETDSSSEIIKKEEDIYLKAEDGGSDSIMPTCFSYNPSYLTMPWKGLESQYSNILFNPLNSFLMSRNLSGQPFTIIRELCPKSHQQKDDIKIKQNLKKLTNKKAVRVSACKNYIGLVCAGFCRTILDSKGENAMSNQMQELLTSKKDKFKSLVDQKVQFLVPNFKQYLLKNICGKKPKKANKVRDFKIRNKEELETLLIVREEDDELVCLQKEVLRELLRYFFNSSHYFEWIFSSMISEPNKMFLLKNKSEIENKFLNPAYYKPQFNY